jgi:replicative DNA helicase
VAETYPTQSATRASARGDDTVGGRVPPQDLDAEKAVLSSVLLDNGSLNEVYPELKPDDFYHPAHKRLFQAMIALNDESQPVDLHTLADYLNGRKVLDAIGGPVFLAEIADYEATAANVQHHARIVRDKSLRRRLITTATEIVRTSYEWTGAGDELLETAESQIFELSQQQGSTTFRSMHDELPDTFNYVDDIMHRAGQLTGCPTGYHDLDEMTGGLQPGELIIIAARPSMGKTALALNMMQSAALDHGKKAAIFSLEMTRRSLVLRMLASEARIDMSTLRRGFLAPVDYQKLTTAAGRLSHADVWIDDSGMVTILEMKAKARRLAAQQGLDLLVVDYLQLAHGDKSATRKDLEIAQISQGLKALAKELDIPVIALSQLNRGPEQRDPDKRRPNMGDLRESGAIEQDADVIGFIYRDVVYNRDTEDPNRAELIIAKQRNGPTGTVDLHFDGRFARFESRTRQEAGDDLPPLATGEGGFVGPPPGEEDEDPFL